MSFLECIWLQLVSSPPSVRVIFTERERRKNCIENSGVFQIPFFSIHFYLPLLRQIKTLELTGVGRKTFKMRPIEIFGLFEPIEGCERITLFRVFLKFIRQ